MQKLQYTADCVHSTAEDIDEMIEKARQIGFSTFIKYVDLQLLNEMFGYGKHLKLKDDWHVTFWKSEFQGKMCYYICHSAIEYVFQ